jgi:hypothetical protein
MIGSDQCIERVALEIGWNPPEIGHLDNPAPHRYEQAEHAHRLPALVWPAGRWGGRHWICRGLQPAALARGDRDLAAAGHPKSALLPGGASRDSLESGGAPRLRSPVRADPDHDRIASDPLRRQNRTESCFLPALGFRDSLVSRRVWCEARRAGGASAAWRTAPNFHTNAIKPRSGLRMRQHRTGVFLAS